ncbi:MAG: GHKL domain-containing protein [Clostridiales bacterium]|nr:GHKL domain-containing protein [Clostridiales bacterium]
MSSELQNIPPFWNALALWTADMLYIHFLPRRKGLYRWRFWLIAAGWFLALWFGMRQVAPLNGVAFNLAYVGIALLTFAPFLCLCKTGPTCSVTYCARSFILGGFTASLAWQLYLFQVAHYPAWDALPVEAAFMLAVYGVIFALMYLLERYNRKQIAEMPISLLSCVSTVLIAFIIYVVSSLSFSGLDTPFGGSTYAEAFNIRSIVYLGGVAILYAHHLQLCESYTTLERNTLETMLNTQYTNYLLNQEAVDMVNRKYHDLKHQIAILRNGVDAAQRLDYLDRMEEEIQVYETQNKTGNQYLDTILTSKSIHCQKEHIQLTCVVDGAALGFLDVMDLSALFGNALDNAIEAVVQLPDPEQRLIHLSVSQERGFLRIRLENRCREEETVTGGLPKTSKRDKRNHGFGLKSICAIAEKYDGSATVHAEKGWFELRVLIPTGQAAEERC